MIDRASPIALIRQCKLLNLNRLTVYYQPKGVSQEELDLMHRINQIHLSWLFLGSRRIRDELNTQCLKVNQQRIQLCLFEICMDTGL